MLVTGASGFIGRNLLASAPRDWEIVALYNRDVSFPAYLNSIGKPNIRSHRCDLTDEAAVRFLQHDTEKSFDLCLFLAANSDPARSVEDPRYDWVTNVGTLLNVLSTFQFNTFLFMSSGAVYDGHRGYVSPQTAIAPRLPYALSKSACERYVQLYHDRGTIDSYLILRFFGAYGPYEPSRKIYTRLVKAFSLDRANEFVVYGDGKNLIDAMYVSDAVTALINVTSIHRANLTLDLCHGSAMTINELVSVAAKVFGIDDVTINHVGNVPEYVQFKASPKKARQVLGTHPTVNLEDGLTKLARFISRSA